MKDGSTQKRIVLANQKGGVGKSSSVVSLAGVYSKEHKVLVVDCDPQANASLSLGLRPKDFKIGTADLFESPEEFSLQEAKITTNNIDLVASDISLSQVEWNLWKSPEKNNSFLYLKRALESSNHDIIIMDTPPALGILTLNALVASHRVLIPVSPEPLGLIGMKYLLNTIQDIKENYNPKLKLLGVFKTMWSDDGSNYFAQMEEQLEAFGVPILNSKIPKNVRVKEAVLEGIPINKMQSWASAAKAYRKLAEEVIKKW
jgi:chromosome partitioning protein